MSFDIALSGLNAISTSLETISHNIANTGTYGFKSSRANFAAMYAGLRPSGVEVSSLTQTLDVGGGVLTTGRSLDVALQGRGFFVTRTTAGEQQYTRAGVFATDKDGFIVDSFARRVQGYQVTPGIPTLGAMGDLRVRTGQIPAQASTQIDYVGNVSADWTAPQLAPFDPLNPQTYNSSVVTVVYDSLGVQHTATQYFVRSGVNQVTVHYGFDGTAPIQTSTLAFDTFGQLASPTGPVTVAMGTPTGANALTVDFNYAGSTQFAGEANTTTNAANGYQSGSLVGVQISADGSVMAQYSNGQKQSIGVIAIATFPAENALQPVSDTSWIETSESGTPLYFRPGSGMAGKLVGGSLEQSNVDMASELVSLMTAQRNYGANSKVISTQNQMIQTLMQAV